MKKNTQQKDFMLSDIHGSAEEIAQAIQKTFKEVGFEPSKQKTISVGSPFEVVPNLNNINAADIVKSVRESIELREKTNIAHHDAQYEKMYPNKLK